MSSREPTLTTRPLAMPSPFDLARTTAPVWWARGRWPNVDWRYDALHWVGWEEDRVVWRSVRQLETGGLAIAGNAGEQRDGVWASRLLGSESPLPGFADPILATLAWKHAGMRAWATGSLYEGFVSAIVGQSISVAAAAVTERRLYESFNNGLELAGRLFWPPPRPDQLAAADPALIRYCGMTQVRADALKAVGSIFCEEDGQDETLDAEAERMRAEQMLSIRGVGRWTVESALLWGRGHADAHPSGDIALLRAAKQHWPEIATLKDLDRLADGWKPNRAWAARLLWLERLGSAAAGDGPGFQSVQSDISQ